MMMLMMMMMIHDDDGDDDDDDDNVKKQVVFWNHDDTFSHATLAKSSFRYSGMLIFCPYNVHFLHGREKVGNLVTLPETNSSPLKMGLCKGNSSSNFQPLIFKGHIKVWGLPPKKTNLKMEHPPFEDVFPIENCDVPI